MHKKQCDYLIITDKSYVNRLTYTKSSVKVRAQ